MASDIQVIRSYLVSLGYAPDVSFANMAKDLAASRKVVEGFTLGIAGDILKWQTAITGMFLSVSGAILGTVDKIAMADQEYRLFGERMGLGTVRAREYKMALDALGQPIEAVAWDPELHERFQELLKLNRQLSTMSGGDFESNMRKARDVEFQFTKMKVEAEGFLMVFANDLVRKLGGGESVLDYLQKANQWLLNNIPKLADELATDAVPILRETWEIVKDLGSILGVAANAFTNMVGVLTGDTSIQGATTDMHQFAQALMQVEVFLGKIINDMLFVERVGAHFGGAFLHGLSGIAQSWSNPAESERQRAAGLDSLRAIGGDWHHANDRYNALEAQRLGMTGADGGRGGAQGGADAYRAAAARVGAMTGIDPALIYGQWAHETGNFTNRGARDLNNLGGVRNRDGSYQSFGSLDEFVARDAHILTLGRYRGLSGTHDPNEYARILKQGGYFTAPLAEYQRGMRQFTPQYGAGGGGGSTIINVGGVHVTQPGASAEEVAHHVTTAINRQQRLQTQRNLVQADGAYA